MKVTYRRPQLHVTELGGKLSGFASISTSALANSYCLDRTRWARDTICAACYARAALSGFRACMAEPLAGNTARLKVPLDQLDLPLITGVVALRFNSHGELGSMWEFDNYVRIAAHNRHLRTALWTKRPGIVDEWLKWMRAQGFEGEDLDPGMRLILSSPRIGERVERDDAPTWAHHVYTVYEREEDFPKDAFPCHGRCRECMVCYDRHMDAPMHIATLLHR